MKFVNLTSGSENNSHTAPERRSKDPNIVGVSVEIRRVKVIFDVLITVFGIAFLYVLYYAATYPIRKNYYAMKQAVIDREKISERRRNSNREIRDLQKSAEKYIVDLEDLYADGFITEPQYESIKKDLNLLIEYKNV